MTKVSVVNVSKVNNYIYCGRGSAVGNPFKMNNNSDLERDRVCDMYYKWFWSEVVDEDSAVSKFITKIITENNSEIRLGCYCYPKRCHCDTIKEYLDKLIKLISE